MKKIMKKWLAFCAFVGLCASAQAVTLAEAIDLPDAPVSGDWVVTSDSYQTGGASAKSSNYHQGNSTSSMTLTVTGAGILTFKWRVSSESVDYDYVTCTVDGTQIGKIGGYDSSVQWFDVTHEITGTGSHTITWTYRKDDSVDKGSDCAWVDAVTWSGTSSLKEVYVNAATGNDANTGASATQAKKTIQAAIDAAAAGGIIYVAAGTYTPITVNKQLTIQGAGAETTIIDGGNSSRCAYFSGTDGYVIKGFALRNGYQSSGNGGGAYYGTLEDCVIDNCKVPTSSGYYGGGAYQSILRRCKIRNCRAYYGGGLHSGMAYNCLFTGNYAYYYGGGAYSSTLRNCTLSDNQVYYYGGAAYSGSAYNSIAYGNTSSYSSSSSYQNFYNVSTYSCYTSDPSFVDAANGNYRLSSGSSCIDAGNNSYSSDEIDLSGLARINGGVVDIGCYEYLCKGAAAEVQTISGLDDFYYDFSATREVIIQNSVTAIPANAFAAATLLERVTVPSSVTSIGPNAFGGCTALNRVNIMDMSKWCAISFGDNPLWQAKNLYLNGSKLTSLTIPSGVTSIAAGAFKNCVDLTEVTIPASVTTIGANAFAGCTGIANLSGVKIEHLAAFDKSNLTSLTLSAGSATSIPADALAGASKLTSMTIPPGVTTIGSRAFKDCSSLTQVTIPESVTTIAIDAFSGCTALNRVNITDLAKWCTISFGDNPLWQAKNLYLNGSKVTSATIPSGVTSIAAGAFKNCEDLTQVTMPVSVTAIGADAFSGCAAIRSVKMGMVSVGAPIRNSDSWILQTDGSYKSAAIGHSAQTSFYQDVAVAASQTYSFQWKVSSESYDKLHVYVDGGEKASAIGGTSMSGFTTVSFTLSAGAHTIEWRYTKDGGGTSGSDCGWVKLCPGRLKDVFPASYAQLTSLEIVSGTGVVIDAFAEDCTSLASVILPDSVRTIGDNAFGGSSTLSYVRFPEGWVFRSADLTRMGIPDSYVEQFKTTDNNWIVMGSTLIAYVGNENVTTLTVPDGIDIIDDEALADLYCLQTVTFAGTERIIGKRAFYECTDLEYVELPETVETIEESAFENCTWIDDVYFPTELKTVGKKAFKGCGQLLECAFYEGFESIGDNAFEDCWRMLSANLPHSLTNVGTGAFSGCDAIIGVVTPSNVKTMSSLFPAAYTQIEQAIIPEGETDIMNSMFSGCTSLDSLVIATTVTNIGTYAFSSCRSLVYQAIPDSVVRLGAYAFSGCSSLELVALSRNLKALENSTFRECDDLTSIIVPASVRTLGSSLFACTHAPIPTTAMRDVYFLGDAPEKQSDTYSGTTAALVTHVIKGSRGWDGIATSKSLPKSWLSHAITYWSPNIFEVTFDPNGGGPEPYKANQITDTTYALPDVDPTRPGYTFAGWWTQPEGGGEVINTTVVHATRAHTLYAHWVAAHTVEILFNPMGGTVEPDSGYYTAGATHVKFPVPTRRGYTFAGWWTGASGGENISESVRVPTVPGTLYAHWTPITYMVEFRSNNGQNLVTTQRFTFNVKGALQPNAFTYADRNFIGWARTAGGSVVHTDGDEVLNWCETQDDKVVLYAKWDGARYAVRFDENGGSGFMTNQTILVNATAALSANKFTREGYTFQGWSLTATGPVVYKDKAAVNNLAGDDGNIVLYAQWKANTYTVRYHYNYGGSTVTKDQTMTYGVAANLLYVNSGLGWTNPSGCSFLGWGESATADLARYANGEKVLNLASAQGEIVHLYAIWMGGAQYAVKFHKNDGGADEIMQQLYAVNQRKRLVWLGSQIGWSRVGYTFLGWAKSASATVPDFLNGETVENIAAKGQTRNLYAVWKPGQVPYKVRFHKNFGDNATCDEAFVFGKEQALLWTGSQLKWTREGYVFVGWGTSAGSSVGLYANGERVLDLAAVKDGVVHLYAVWAKAGEYYILKLYRQQTSGDTVAASIRMPKRTATSIAWMGSQLGWALQDCSFFGWATAANTRVAKYQNGEKVTDLAAAGKTASLYAVWQPKNTYVVKFHRATGSTDTATASQWFYRGTTSGLAWMGSGLGWTPADLAFCGWSRSATSATVSHANGQSVTDLAAAGATLDLYAVWSYQTVFNQNVGGGSLTATRTYYIGQQAQIPWLDAGLKFTRAGYTFLGWALTPTGAVVYRNGAKELNIIYSGSTLYARWQANPPAVASMRATYASLQNAAKAMSRTWTAGYYRGEFADDSGTFDLVVEEDGAAFFAATTEDGFWSAECEAEVVGETLLLTFEDVAPLAVRLENGMAVGEPFATARP